MKLETVETRPRPTPITRHPSPAAPTAWGLGSPNRVTSERNNPVAVDPQQPVGASLHPDLNDGR
jgi:hypothetical protein